MLVSKFEEHVYKTPQSIAVKAGGEAYTYEALNRKADSICSLLADHGDKGRIGLIFSHGFSMVASLLGVLKANMTYVPMPDYYPFERLMYMAEDSGISLLLTDSSGFELSEQIGEKMSIPVICTDMIKDDENSPDFTRRTLKTVEIAYILYTSGSTGSPKGVCQTHENIDYFIQNYTLDLGITNSDRLTCISSLGHDASVMDIYSALLTGASLYMLDFRKQKAFSDISQWVKNEKVTLWHSVPTVYRYFVNSLTREDIFPDLRSIVLGGEPVLKHDIHMHKEFFPNAMFHSLYGQTESSYNCLMTINNTSQEDTIRLGEPVRGTEIFIVDSDGNETDVLEAGEILVKSAHLSPGYLNDNHLTEDRFVPFFDEDDRGAANHSFKSRLYRTGDMGRMMPDGEIEFIGRIDNQIKIRGFRVEPGEIESRLLLHKNVEAACVVSVKNRSFEDVLCAYLVADIDISAFQYKKYLQAFLPDYMIPARFILLEEMPLLENNKVDRSKLPPVSDIRYEKIPECTPFSGGEKKLSDLWGDVLEISTAYINSDSNFFEMGGHSLKAIRLLSRINKHFETKLTLKEIFENPTFCNLFECIRNSRKKNYLPIDRAGYAPYYPATPEQKRMFILNALEGIGTSYNLSNAFLIKNIFPDSTDGSLVRDKIENVLKKIVDRHESLRTSFEFIKGEPVQMIHDEVTFHLSYFDSEKTNVHQVAEQIIRPFDLGKAPLFRAGLIKTDDGSYLFVVDMHHIISDRTSIHILIEECMDLFYNIDLPEPEFRYVDYAVSRNDYLDSPEYKKHEAYWTDLFKGELPILNMPLDFPRPPVQSFDGDIVHFSFEKEGAHRINSFLVEQEATLFTLLLSVLNTLLYRYTGQNDIIVGTAFSGRDHEVLENIVGMFVKTIALRNFPGRHKSFREFLREVRDHTLSAYENIAYPFGDLINQIHLTKDMSRNPLFDVMLVVHNMDLPDLKEETNDSLKATPFQLKNHSSIVDFSLNVIELSDQIHIYIEYNTHLLSKVTMERFSSHFKRIITGILQNPDERLSEIDFLSKAEKKVLFSEFNSKREPHYKWESIIEVFERTVRENPEKRAVFSEDKEITYRNLNEKVNQVARKLLEYGAGPESIIPVMVDPGLEMIIGVLGVLKSGSAYLPIDPSYPDSRIEYIFSDSSPSVILSVSTYQERTDCISGRGRKNFGIIHLDDEALSLLSVENVDILIRENSSSYVIYTSGSTGNPKGVIVTHGNLAGYINAFDKAFHISVNDIVLQQSSFCFDTFIEEVFPVLLKGGGVAIPMRKRIYDMQSLSDFIYNKNVTLISASPLLLNELNRWAPIEKLCKVHTIISGGDVLEKKYIDRLIRIADVYNTYGPTETTVCATFHKCTPEDENMNVPIGRPFHGYSVYILDENRLPVPIGVEGEICITGCGVARGYLNRRKLSSEKFTDSPFDHPKDTNERNPLYLTGDIGRYLPDGTILYTGRKDDMVNIRGYRIEPGEIKSMLLFHKDIEDAAVLSMDNNSYLCAYFVSTKILDSKELRDFLLKKIPVYMVPSFFVGLNEIPVTQNGKIDKKALPDPKVDLSAGVLPGAVPRNQVEEHVLNEWKGILGVGSVGIFNNFFESGGDSLKAIQLVYQLSDRFDIQINDIFMFPTVAELSSRILSDSQAKKKKIRDVISYVIDPPEEMNTFMKNRVIEVEKYKKQVEDEKLKYMTHTDKYTDILITGATGFLGAHITYELIRSSECRIYLLVRGKTDDNAELKLQKKFSYYFGEDFYGNYSHRLFPVSGDITKNRLGIPQKRYDRLCEKVDAVIHSAANVKHYGIYEDFYLTNVVGTRNLLSFCLWGREKDFHHISTLSIGLLPNSSGASIFTEYDVGQNKPSEISNVYIKTKQEAEDLALSYRKEGVNVSIYRVGNLVAHSENGKFQENIEENSFYAKLKAIITLGMIPETDTILPDLTFIDQAAKAIVTLLSLKNQTFHVFNSESVHVQDIVGYLRDAKINLKLSKPRSFAIQLDALIHQKESENVVRDLLLHSGLFDFSDEALVQRHVTSERTDLILNKFGFKWPRVNSSHIQKMIHHCKEVGFINVNG